MQDSDFQIITEVVVSLVNRIVCYFMNTTTTTTHSFYRHFDVDLSKYDDYCFIQVTNCNQSEGYKNIKQYCFDDVLTGTDSETCIEKITLFIKRGLYQKEFVHELQKVENNRETYPLIMTRKCEHLARLKKYLSVRFKCKLSSRSIEIFKASIVRNFENMNNWEPNIRFTFHSGEKIYWRNHVGLDKPIKSCGLVSSGIMTIVRQTNNSRFRERCLKLLNIDDASKIEDAIMNKFLILIQHKFENKKKEGVNNYALNEMKTRRN